MIPETETTIEEIPQEELGGHGSAAPGEPFEAPPAEEVAPELLRVQLRNGRTYTGKTEREIMQAMASDFERYQTDNETRGTQTREAQAKIGYQQEHSPQGAWDAQKYLDLLGKDPMAARVYQDRHYYGMGENEDPAQAFRFMYTTTDKLADRIEIAAFHDMNRDAEGRPTTTMTQEDSVAVLRKIDSEGLELNARNLNAVYHELVNQGVVRKSASPATASVTYQDIDLGTPAAQPQSRGAGAPRATGGIDRNRPPSAKDYENMTLEQITAEARKAGML